MKEIKILVGDFETTVYDEQESTEVWASALVEMYTENVVIFHSIDETFFYIKNLYSDCLIYYHNLKFDGAFWLDFLLKNGFTNALDKETHDWLRNKDMQDGQIKYLISDMGQWYTITIKIDGHIIELRDSLKLLPFSVKKIGKSFGTKHKKLDMEYKGLRFAGCVITDEEKRYIANDVLVVKEALEIMYDEGHEKMTIGSCCLSEYIKIIGKYAFEEMFPDLTKIELDEAEYGSKNADEYIRKSYHGGWCYVVDGKQNKVFGQGLTCDVNSLYPSMMSSESGNYYPTGKPAFRKGGISSASMSFGDFYFIRFRCRFYLKEGYLPTIQIKGSPYYRSTEWLKTSDYYDEETGKYYASVDTGTEIKQMIPTLTLSCIDFELFKEHYYIYDFEALDNCTFFSQKGIFDEYIEKYKKIKMESTGAIRELAKLFLNNLYGKMSSSTISDFKYAEIEDGKLVYYGVPKNDKKAGYIAVGSAITAYARRFTITAAQKNYYGVENHGFIYADTDSIHCDLKPDQLVDVPVDPVKFCNWKVESCWDEAIFVRQKTYMEHITMEDMENIEKPYYNCKCAGLPERAKKMLVQSITKEYDFEGLTERQIEFVKQERTIADFKVGLIVPDGKLLPKRVEGGIILVDTDYKMRR